MRIIANNNKKKGGIKMPYIYKITNKINGKLYIGKTSLPRIEDRMW